jgi:hypothetical protein
VVPYFLYQGKHDEKINSTKKCNFDFFLFEKIIGLSKRNANSSPIFIIWRNLMYKLVGLRIDYMTIYYKVDKK